MEGLYFLLPTLLMILFSFFIVRAGAIALMMTGLDEKRARFQALSAFSGTGFTTHEAESVINNPKRRKIISVLMITGNAGVVAVIVAATSSVVKTRGYFIPINVLLLGLGVYVVYRFATHKGIIKKWEDFIEDRFGKSGMFEESDDAEDLLHLFEGYGLVKVTVDEQSSLNGRTLADCRLNMQGILVLGIEREKSWIPVPHGDAIMHAGDRLVVYGPLNEMKVVLKEAT